MHVSAVPSEPAYLMDYSCLLFAKKATDKELREYSVSYTRTCQWGEEKVHARLQQHALVYSLDVASKKSMPEFTNRLDLVYSLDVARKRSMPDFSNML